MSPTASVRLERLVRAMQHEPALGLDGTAVHHGAFGEGAVLELDGELTEHFAEREVARAIDHDAERALVVVLADVGDGLV